MNEHLPEPNITEFEADFATLDEMRANFGAWAMALSTLEELSNGGDSDEV